ncbi:MULTISPECIES: hypothetical protein [unclassified Nonomuraea]|jgi:hypothetical protein|uniref:hypothetical protein n=1 Tax=unclassified Nonomuraea TaxID=2593643 RepID=UPI001BE3FE78|nr:hypothetical protein [Nonomuraea sp. NEAU-A123]MBT2224831.1 hypothetical protein [Nonomuraea sp. NEAU-A123]
MSDQHIDPAGNTQQFRAFAQRSEQEAAPSKKSPLLPIIAVIAVVVIIGVAAFLILR